jgi:hypothetical protein
MSVASDFATSYLRSIVAESLRSGTSEFFESFARELNPAQLKFLIGILDKVRRQKEGDASRRTSPVHVALTAKVVK